MSLWVALPLWEVFDYLCMNVNYKESIITHGASQSVKQIIVPMIHPEVYVHLGVAPPLGLLLHGPAGCGKTLLAHAVAGVS